MDDITRAIEEEARLDNQLGRECRNEIKKQNRFMNKLMFFVQLPIAGILYLIHPGISTCWIIVAIVIFLGNHLENS
jgi:hypothetical protein